MWSIDELHSNAAWLEAIEGMTFFGKPVSEMKEDELRLLVGFLVNEKRILGFQPSYWRRERQPQPSLTDEERLRVALSDAIRRPMGVIPESAEGLITERDLDASERRRLS